MGKQCLTMTLVEGKIIHEATFCFFNIGSCLIEGEGKKIKRDDNITRLVDLFIRRVLKPLRSTKQQLRAFEEPHCFDFDGGGQRPNSMSTSRQQNAPIACLRKILAYESHFIGVIKDQQPAMLTVLQPMLDSFHDLALIHLLLCSQ